MSKAESWATSDRSRNTMRSTKSRDTKPELALRSELHRRGRRFRVATRPLKALRRTADVVFTRQRLAIMVDGCYWHGCPEHYTAPVQNAGFWASKVALNRARDQDTNERLRTDGWTVLRVWEHVPTAQAADLVEANLERLSKGERGC